MLLLLLLANFSPSNSKGAPTTSNPPWPCRVLEPTKAFSSSCVLLSCAVLLCLFLRRQPSSLSLFTVTLASAPSLLSDLDRPRQPLLERKSPSSASSSSLCSLWPK
ncbi:uncharacterized protein ARB_01299 [Trichophyton benhamiae CBS 112371]|uniref:Uncharacterized protein n=1 Tax=Arthroderma benhamiae (strain ATCC MYA-4681 / CBS 112371) TaxID=663331 RepID=D4AYN0_ARTBC|nr:uncharacterized protein ARB_01299 [Trichophyton benhamiae CBS 112371]EFE31700.1 hypothetical protein ARB_01299 [Trichophyton benhamiae CBS 112371]